MTEAGKDAVVIGGGIVGICCALSLQDKGYDVTVMDRAGPDEQRASFGNAGNLSVWSCVPESVPGLWKSVPGWLLDPLGPMAIRKAYLPRIAPWILTFLAAGRARNIPAQADALRSLNASSVDLYEAIARRAGTFDLIKRCLNIYVYRDGAKANLESLGWQLRRERGARIRHIKASELSHIEPDLSRDYEAAIVIEGQGRVVDPQRLHRSFCEFFQRRGGHFLRTEVRRIAPAPYGIEVELPDRIRTFSLAVLAAGAWSVELLRRMGVRIPLETERGYHLMAKDPGVTVNNTIMEAEKMVVANTMEGGLRLAGTVELAGLEAAPAPKRSASLKVLGGRMFPGANLKASSEWMGHRPSLPDSLPVIGRCPGQPNLLFAFGHSHLGLTGAAPTGALIAQIARGEPTDIDIYPFRADRF